MKPLSSILFFFIIISFLLFSIVNFAIASSLSLSDIETKITPQSNGDKIKKLQTLFQALGLYAGPIDGKYQNIKNDLVDYQIKSGIIKNKDDWGAGYFGKKTIFALERDFADKFSNLKEIIKEEKPALGEKTFIVTAYYSPLANQKNYVTGSYAGDKRLNGNGKITASGKKVLPGVLAAPRNYDFGTKIYLEGIGVGSVEDRGGAIVNSGDRGYEYDRIDIWMGYGDDGLARAIKWGKKTIKGSIVSDDISSNIEFSPQFIANSFSVTPNSQSSDIKKLQNLFKDLGLYNGTIDGKYSSIKDDLIDYQVSSRVISSANSIAAGYFGPKTIASIKKDYNVNIFVEKSLEEDVDEFLLSSIQKKKIESISKKIISHVYKKSNGDNLKKRKYLNNLKNKLDTYIDKTKNTNTKRQLQYLQSII